MAYISDEYLAASISKISSYMKISEAVAGATLLALANGACDILTIILASGKENDHLASGVLFGANLFLAAAVLTAVIYSSRNKIATEVISA